MSWIKRNWYIPAGGLLLIASGSNNIISILKKTVGIRETGQDSGFTNKAFEAELKALEWQPGWAWCVMFAKRTWSHWLKGDKRKVAMNLMQANSQVTWNNFKKDKSGYFVLTTSGKPKHVGAIAIFQNVYNSARGHAAVVTEIHDNHFVATEGNYNNQVEGNVIRPYNYNTANKEGLRLIGFINVK